MSNLHECLKMFVSKDPLRVSLNQPIADGQYIYGTDGIATIRFDRSDLPDIDCVSSENVVSVLKTYFEVTPNEMDILNPDSVKKWLSGVKMIPKFDDCDECDGSGDVYCDHCKHYHECDSCRGTGEGEKIGEFFDYSAFLTFKGHISRNKASFSAQNLNRILKLSEMLNASIEWIYCPADKKASVFKIDKCLVLMMPKGQ